MPDPVPPVEVEPVPVDVVEEPTDEPVPVADCDEIPLDVEFELDEVDPVLPDEVLGRRPDYMAARLRSARSARTSAVIASTTGTARGTRQGS